MRDSHKITVMWNVMATTLLAADDEDSRNEQPERMQRSMPYTLVLTRAGLQNPRCAVRSLGNLSALLWPVKL